MLNHQRSQLIHNINTLVEMSDFSVKVSLDGQDYWLQGIDEYGNRVVLQVAPNVVIQPKNESEETWEVLTETLLHQCALAALSQVGLPFSIYG